MGKTLSNFNEKLRVAMNMPAKEEEPFISMNKLAEYMQADSIRRREIVKILKKDSDFISNWYHRVYKMIPKYFKSQYSDKLIDGAISKIDDTETETDWEKSDKDNSILALECLKETDLPDLTDYEIVNDLKKLDEIYLAGVRISLKPDIYLRNKHSGKIGALKAHVIKSKRKQLDEESRKYAATLLKIGFIEKGYKAKEIDNNACISLDVFNQGYDVAPGAYKLRRTRLEASCEEISLWWQSM